MGVKVYTWSICRVLIDTIDIFNIIKTWELICSLNLVVVLEDLLAALLGIPYCTVRGAVTIRHLS